MVSWRVQTARRASTADYVIRDMSETIFELVKNANGDKYIPAKPYKLFDEDDADCYGVNPDQHHDVSRECIENFIWLIFKNTQMEEECLIPSVMYMQKILSTRPKHFMSKLRMYSKNWKTIVGMSMLIAAKVWDDFHMDNVSFLTFLYCMDLQRCNKLEALFLKVIDFDVSIKHVAYKEYEQGILYRKSLRVTSSVKKPKAHVDDIDASTVSISTGASESTLMTLFTNDPANDDNSSTDKENEISPNKNAILQNKKNRYSVKMKTNRVNNLLSSSNTRIKSYQLRCDSYSSFLESPSSTTSPNSILSKIKGAMKVLLPFVRTSNAKVSLTTF
jgi:hypothetical protein